jgi:hypothetical protein
MAPERLIKPVDVATQLGRRVIGFLARTIG